MRVFHGPNNVAGAAEIIARAQRDLGYDSKSVCFATPNFAGPVDEVLRTDIRGRLSLLLAARRFDVFHFYFGNTLLAGLGLADVVALQKLGKQVFMYFCGCDIRDSKTVLNSHAISACANCWPQKCHPKRDDLAELMYKFDGLFVSTPDLLDFAPTATWLPQPIDLAYLSKFSALRQSREKACSRTIRIAHGPSSRDLKGTIHVEEAIKTLKRRGYPVELVLIEGQNYENALKLCASADIAIDQLLIGSYGQFSVEAMALGLPVICYIRDDLKQKYPLELPIISANPDTIIDVLADLIDNQESWASISALGVKFVNNFHQSHKVAEIAASKYRNLSER
jgi:hypothetical protein